MAIDQTYREFLINEFIKSKLEEGITLTAEDVIDELETYLTELDLTVPQFVSSSFYTEEREASSADKNENTLISLRQDLQVLYLEMAKLAKTSINSYERWDLEARNLEKQLIDLEERIQNLLFLTQDTEGYHSIIVDNFGDTSKVDMLWTDADVDIYAHSIELSPTGTTFQQIFLNNLLPNNVTFSVRSTVNLLGRTENSGVLLTDIFHQESKVWWTNVKMKKPGTVTAELTVRISDSAIPINRISLELHESAEASPVTIVPLLSTDNINFEQIPSNTFLLESRNTALFTFPNKDAKWVKFILSKKGPDISGSDSSFGYQFGFKSIKFYQQAFNEETPQYFVSTALSVLDPNGEVKDFEKITLETCERVETGTSINYFVTFSNDPTVPLILGDIEDAATWYPIAPINRAEPLAQVVLDIGDVNESSIGDDETVQVSEDGDNPALTFQLLSDNSGTVQDDTVTATEARYSFVNPQDRILNYQIKVSDYLGEGADLLDARESDLVVFRNIGEKGLLTTDPNTLVRETLRGWNFEEPFYSCVIEVRNPNGLELDVGESTIWIDDLPYKNQITSKILTGKTSSTTGIHRVKVHKQNWKEVTPGLETAAALELADPFVHKYNHKLLIEGYDYGPLWPSTVPKVYKGADLFAEYLLKQVSAFDFMYNAPTDNYSIYALDLDAPETHNGNDPTQVFLVKIDNENADSQNERFMIRFKQINLLQKYLRLRADLNTSDSQITPSLQSYKIKLG